MTIELIKALLIIARFCIENSNCRTCALKEFCGKLPSEW